MRQIFILLAFFSFSNYLFSQNNCDIIANYGDFIKVEKGKYKDNEFLIKRVIETESNRCYSKLVNNNLLYIDYLLNNFSSNLKYPDLLKISDSLTLQTEYIKSLKGDTLFNSVMVDLLIKTIEKRKPKDTISMDKLLNIAIKYFSILQINDDGDYVGKVCVGLNLIKQTEKIRKPQVEAFCFSSILNNYQGEQFNMYDEFVKSLTELNKVNLGVDKDEKLLRAQGAMFLLMRNNENLKKMLVSEYEKNKENLPFLLKY